MPEVGVSYVPSLHLWVPSLKRFIELLKFGEFPVSKRLAKIKIGM